MSKAEPKVNRAFVFALLCTSVAALPLLAQEATPDPMNFEKTKAQAEAGDAVGQRELGKHYLYGAGVAGDFSEACKWFRKAAEQNDAEAQYDLGSVYDEGGEGVPRDLVEACKWYRKAAEQNYAKAQCCLGNAYNFGTGVPQDNVQAYKWLALAAAQGDQNGKNALKLLEEVLGLTPAQKAEGEKLVRGFKPSPPSVAPKGSPTATSAASPPMI